MSQDLQAVCRTPDPLQAAPHQLREDARAEGQVRGVHAAVPRQAAGEGEAGAASAAANWPSLQYCRQQEKYSYIHC